MINLVNNLSFGEKINSVEAVTESGKQFLKGYRGYIYSNPVSCALVNGFCNEAARNYNFDSGVKTILESVLEYVNENNISWKLASACESIANNNSPYNYIAKTAVNQVEQLLENNEAAVVSYIKSGALRGIQYVKEFRDICKEVYATNVVVENKTLTYESYMPVSYVFTNENDETFFMVNGKTFMMNESTVCESKCEDKTFNRVNAILANMAKVNENLTYKFETGFSTTSSLFTISESQVSITRNGNEKAFESASAFIEHCDTISTTMPMHERVAFMQTVNAVAEVFESVDNICELDHVKVIKTINNEVAAVVEGKENVNVAFFNSRKVGNVTESFDSMIEGTKYFENVTGVSLMTMYQDRIVEEAKKNDNSVENDLKEIKEAQIEDRRNRIAMLAEQYKNDPVKIALLNKCAQELSLLDA